MSAPINLNKVRKARARAARKAQAEANVTAFGRTKSEKTHAQLENSRSARDLDGKALDTPPNRTDDDPKSP